MCSYPEDEIKRAKLIPLRRWVPECFSEEGALILKPLPSDDDGVPLTRREAFFFWLPVWFACVVLGIVVGFAFFAAKAWVHQL